MKMRWYQHSTQGGSCMISLKKSAPSVDVLAITQQAKTSIHAASGDRSRRFITTVASDCIRLQSQCIPSHGYSLARDAFDWTAP